MTKRLFIIILTVLITAIISLGIFVWINGTPWGKKSAEEKFSAVLQEHFDDEVKIDKVVYSWKADRYEAYAVNLKTQTEYRFVFSEMNEADCFYTNLSTGKRYILPVESAYEYAKNNFSESEIFYLNFLNCISDYDDIISINRTLQDNSYACNRVGVYYCYGKSQPDFDEETAESIIALMQRTQLEKIEFYDTHIQFFFNCTGAAYQESIIYYHNDENSAGVGEIAFEGELADNWYYTSQ